MTEGFRNGDQRCPMSFGSGRNLYHSLMLNISEMAKDMAVVTVEGE